MNGIGVRGLKFTMNQLKKYVENFTKQQSFASERCFDFQRDWVDVRLVLWQIAY